jgi:hypothetical protein
MLKRVHSFRTDETGAITVDWVVLTAAIAGLAAIIYFILSQGLLTAGQPIANVEVEEMVFE